jgi:hypothetical protein
MHFLLTSGVANLLVSGVASDGRWRWIVVKKIIICNGMHAFEYFLVFALN